MRSLKPFAVTLALAFAALVPTPAPAFPDAGQAVEPLKWWQSEKYVKALVLLPEQSRQIEDIFQKAVPKLKETNSALVEAEAKFERLIERGDDGLVMEQINVMEAARAELSKARTLMLYDMRKVLTKEQWAKFKTMRPPPPPAPATGTAKPK